MSPPPADAATLAPSTAPPQLVPFLDDARRWVDAALAQRLRVAGDDPGRLVEAMNYAATGPGKRLRPAILLAAAEACGGTRDAALPAACAIEMLHAYTLVHDDLPAMDDDDERRGRPTVHVAFGEAIAILAGDGLLTGRSARSPSSGRAPPRRWPCSRGAPVRRSCSPARRSI